MGHYRHQRAAVVPFPAPLQGDKTGRFAAGSQQSEPLLHLQPHANGDAHTLFSQEATATPPTQSRIVADIGPVEDAELAALELDQAMLLGLQPGASRIRPAETSEPANSYWRTAPVTCTGLAVKAQVAAHHADAMVAVTGKVVEGRMHPAK